MEDGFELDLACLRVLLGEIMMSQDIHFCGSWKRERELVVFYTISHVELQNSTSPKDYFPVLKYKVHFAFSLSSTLLGTWVLVLLLQHALIIGDSQLCFIHCDTVEDEGYLVPFWMERSSYHLEAHRILQ